MDDEIWKDIINYEGIYQISNQGRVRSLNRIAFLRQDRYADARKVHFKGKILKNYNDGTGRRMVGLCHYGLTKFFAVHRLVATHFIDNPNNYPVVNHKNNNHLDNRASNLEWCTTAYNVQHMYNSNRRIKSKLKPNKLTTSDIVKIKKLLKTNITNISIARLFKVHPTTITHIKTGRNWKHIKINN